MSEESEKLGLAVIKVCGNHRQGDILIALVSVMASVIATIEGRENQHACIFRLIESLAKSGTDPEEDDDLHTAGSA